MKIKNEDKIKALTKLREKFRGKKQSPSAVPQADAAEKSSYSFKLLFIIIEEGFADEIADFLHDAGIFFNLILKGTGSASSHVLNLLGLGDTTRSVILSVVETDKTGEVIEQLRDLFKTTGVIFSVRLNSLGGRKLLNYLQGENPYDNTNK